MSDPNDPLAIALFGEIFMSDQLAKSRLTKALPKGMEISHFSILNHLAGTQDERSPAQLAKTFNLTRGAITNTLNKLEWAGYVHIRPDWDDARRKFVSISPSGRKARDTALESITQIISGVVDSIGKEKIRAILPILRDLRIKLADND